MKSVHQAVNVSMYLILYKSIEGKKASETVMLIVMAQVLVFMWERDYLGVHKVIKDHANEIRQKNNL